MSGVQLQVRVQPFARAREACGKATIQLSLPAGATVADCLERLQQSFPALRALQGRMLVAVNERYSGPAQALADGDVVALIPPVSGG